MSARYTINSPDGGIAITGATPLTLLGFLHPQSGGRGLSRIIELGLGFDGITPANRPVLVELFSWDNTAGAGASDLIQSGGPTRTADGTGIVEFTVEPTVITRIKAWRIRPDGGLVILQGPLGREIFEQVGNTDGYVIRVSADDDVVFDGYMEVEEG
jgi:hypothetical protein